MRVLFRSRDFHVRNTILFPRAFPCTSSLNESAVDQRWISKDLILIRQKNSRDFSIFEDLTTTFAIISTSFDRFNLRFSDYRILSKKLS